MPDLLLASLVVSLAMFIRGFTGFGGAILTVPFLGLIWGVDQAIVVVAVLQLVSGLILTFISRRQIAVRTLRLSILWSLGGLLLGTLLLVVAPLRLIAIALGCFSIFAGVTMLRRRKLALEPDPRNWLVTAGVGSLAGTFHGMVGTGGPIIVPFLQRQLKAIELRSTLLAYFLILDVLRMAGYVTLGIAESAALINGLFLLPITILAGWLGGRAQLKVSEARFRVVVAVLLIVAGIALLR